jgi:hypothetical protein
VKKLSNKMVSHHEGCVQTGIPDWIDWHSSSNGFAELNVKGQKISSVTSRKQGIRKRYMIVLHTK